MNKPSYLNNLDPTLVKFLQKTSTDDLTTADGLYKAEQLTKSISTAHTLTNALLKLPANEYSTLFKREEQTLINASIAMQPALFNLRIAVEGGSQRAKREVTKIYELLIKNTDTMASEFLFGFVSVAKRAEFPLPKSVIEASQRDRVEQLDTKFQHVPIPDSPNGFVKQIMREMPKNATSYDIYEILYGHGANGATLPHIAAAGVACFLTSKYEIVHGVALLLLLYLEADVRQAAHETFIHVYPDITLSPLNYSRLFQIFYWLPKNEAETLCNALSLDLNNPPAKPKIKNTFLKAAGYFCDGVGCYAATLGFKTTEGYRIAQLLCKEKVGIKDTFFIPKCANQKALNKEFDSITREGSAGVLTIGVTLAALIPQWKHFLSVGLENNIPPAPIFLVVSELIDEHYWHPEPINTTIMAKEFDTYRSGDAEEILEDCIEWLHPFTDIPLQSWFIESSALNKLITRAKRERWCDERLEENVMKTLLVPERDRWLVRFILCALILRNTTQTEYRLYLNEFSTLIHSAIDEKRFKENPFMLSVGDISIEEAKMRSDEEGYSFEVI